MKSRLFQESRETLQTGAERWVLIFPDDGGYMLHDLMHGDVIGRILIEGVGELDL